MTGPLAVLDLETTELDVLADRIVSIDVLQVGPRRLRVPAVLDHQS